MNTDQAKYCIDYLSDEAFPFQLTCDGHGSFTIDLVSGVCYELLANELQEKFSREFRTTPVIHTFRLH